jgi:hypothetical protein
VPKALAALPNGDVAIGGLALNVPGQPGVIGLLRYQQGTVSVFPGTPTALVSHLAVAGNGDLLVRSGNNISRWHGSGWTTTPPIPGTGIGQLPIGEIVTVGPAEANGGGAASAVHRYRNGTWQSFGEVLGEAEVVTTSGRGDLLVGGPILTAGGGPSFGFALAQPACPAAASVSGSGCIGAAGAVVLAADVLPWIGGTYRANATGMTASSLALSAFGTPANGVPLPGGAAGCSVFVVPLATGIVLPTGGGAEATLAVPAQPALVGASIRHQLFGVELGAPGIVQLTSSNALDLTIGAL